MKTCRHCAREGPRPNTVLDALQPGTLIGIAQVVEVIPCDEDAWASKGFARRPALIGGG